ncbi:ferredoxin [Streptomyces orinoci]|uniref:Ferredoxin n=2 Tax=Streptomyces orinoci TaxID=67339 RepID=A0ABV3JVC2_STRON|nr:ferredoxin [Streptomyces orinoci]
MGMSMSRWQLAVDRGCCVGSGQCAALAPGAFRLDAAHKSHPVTPESEPSRAVLDAAEACPVEAITIRRADTGELVFPGP